MNDEPKKEASKQSITAITCGPQCVDGKEHIWDGPEVKLENGGSSSCSKCGKLAIDVSMWD